MKFFKTFLDSYFDIDVEEYGVCVNCYLNNGLSKKEVESYWLEVFSLAVSCLKKSTWKKGDRGIRKNTHPYGVCTLRLCRTDIAQHIFGAIQEYGYCIKPEWLS